MRNILVSLLVNVGDVIMMTSALELTRRGRPQVGLTVLVRPEAAELFEGNPAADGAIIYPYRSGSLFHGLGSLRRQIKDGGFDYFLSLDRRPRGAAAAWLGGIKTRVGPNLLFAGSRPEGWTRWLFTQEVQMTREECDGDLAEMFQTFTRRALNLEGSGRITLPPVSPENRAWADSLFQEAAGPVIGLCVKTNDPSKTWPAANYAALMAGLKAELGAFLYVTGAPGDRDYVQAVIEAAKAGPILNLAGRTSLMGLGALAAQSDLYITPDNGSGHIAANCGQQNIICILRATPSAKQLLFSMPQARFLAFPPTGPAAEEDRNQIDLVLKTARELLKSDH